MARGRVIRAKVNAHTVISAALNAAIQSAMNKADKYTEKALTETQRRLLAEHLSNYFWLAVEEDGVEFK